MTYRLVEMKAPSCGCGKRMWATKPFQHLEVQNHRNKSSNEIFPQIDMYMLTQDSFCCKCSECHIVIALKIPILLIGKGRITDKSPPPAQLHLHVLLCLGSCCQDVIYFGVTHERYERALTCMVTQLSSRFYCKSLPGRREDTVKWVYQHVWCMHKNVAQRCVWHSVTAYVSLCSSKRNNYTARESCACVPILRGG